MLKSQRAAGFHGDEQVPTPDRWGEVFGDDVVTAAMIDRLVHHADVISLKGDSYRLKDRDLGRLMTDRNTDT
jgi:hypothetical protein